MCSGSLERLLLADELRDGTLYQPEIRP